MVEVRGGTGTMKLVPRASAFLFAITFAVMSFSVSAPSGTRSSSSSCPMSHVQYKSYAGVDQGLASVPWIAAVPTGSFKAHLFYYGNTRWAREKRLGARIFTTKRTRNINPKVLWITKARGYGLKLTIRGQRLDAPGSFTASYEGWREYPSYVDVPTAGCWRVTVKSGRVSGRVVFTATD